MDFFADLAGPAGLVIFFLVDFPAFPGTGFPAAAAFSASVILFQSVEKTSPLLKVRSGNRHCMTMEDSVT